MDTLKVGDLRFVSTMSALYVVLSEPRSTGFVTVFIIEHPHEELSMKIQSWYANFCAKDELIDRL